MKYTILPLLLAAATQAQTVPPVFPLTPPSASTVPANGDVNPYGVVFVPRSVPAGGIQPGDILVSNFNNSQNLQGTGTTIVRISPAGTTSLFYQGKQLGLTAALGILGNGIVIVGNLPTADGTAATVQAGALNFIDRNGNFLGQVAGNGVNGPWGMALYDPGTGAASIFVSNVLSGTVLRLNVGYDRAGESLTVASITTIASGFNHRVDPAALVLGPSGLYYDSSHDLLYIASSADNAVYSVASARILTATAGTGTVVYQDPAHLHGPLDLTFAPNGHLLIANSDGSNADPNQPSELVEFTTTGQFVAQYSIDPNNGGAFGLNLFNIGFGTVRIAAVDDNANVLRIWTTVVP